jgi:hypothetical protein
MAGGLVVIIGERLLSLGNMGIVPKQKAGRATIIYKGVADQAIAQPQA